MHIYAHVQTMCLCSHIQVFIELAIGRMAKKVLWSFFINTVQYCLFQPLTTKGINKARLKSPEMVLLSMCSKTGRYLLLIIDVR